MKENGESGWMIHSYITWREAVGASDYFSEVGQFTATQRFLAKYVGAIVMYYIGRKMKKKYVL